MQLCLGNFKMEGNSEMVENTFGENKPVYTSSIYFK